MFMPCVFAPPIVVLGSGGSQGVAGVPVHTVVAINRLGTAVTIMNGDRARLGRIKSEHRDVHPHLSCVLIIPAEMPVAVRCGLWAIAPGTSSRLVGSSRVAGEHHQISAVWPGGSTRNGPDVTVGYISWRIAQPRPMVSIVWRVEDTTSRGTCPFVPVCRIGADPFPKAGQGMSRPQYDTQEEAPRV